MNIKYAIQCQQIGAMRSSIARNSLAWTRELSPIKGEAQAKELAVLCRAQVAAAEAYACARQAMGLE